MRISTRDIMLFSEGTVEQGKGWIRFIHGGTRYFAVTTGNQLIVFTGSEYDSAIKRGKLFAEKIRKFKKEIGIR